MLDQVKGVNIGKQFLSLGPGMVGQKPARRLRETKLRLRDGWMPFASALSPGGVMDLLRDQGLLLWAVWRSLDDHTGSLALWTTFTAPERLARWRGAALDDRALSQAVHDVYVSSGSMRQPGEPWVKLCGKYIKGKIDVKKETTLCALLATCGDDLLGLRDRALLLLLWRNHWTVGDRSIKETVRLDIGDAPPDPEVTTWIQAAGIGSGPLFRHVLDGDVKEYGLEADDAKYIVQCRAVAAGLAEWNPMLWVSWTDYAIDTDPLGKDEFRKPHLQGRALLSLVRRLLQSGEAPPLPPAPYLTVVAAAPLL